MFEPKTDPNIEEPTGETPSSQPDGSSPPAPGSDWRAAIPSEFADAASLKDIPDVGTLAKNYVHAQQLIGNSVRKPGPDASAEDKQAFIEKMREVAPNLVSLPDPDNEEESNAFWESVGVPSDHKAYDVEEGLEVDENWLEGVKEQGKRYGLTKAKFRQFVKDTVERQKESAAKGQEAQAADMKTLSQEWGNATEARLNDIKEFAEVFKLPESFRKALTDGQVSSEWLKPMHDIIQQLGGLKEGQEVSFQPGGSVPDSPQEMKVQLAEIHANPDYFDSRSPRQKMLIEKAFKLTEELDRIARQN